MITWNDYKVTANQVAKLMVEDWGSRAAENGWDDVSMNVDAMTEREIGAVNAAIEHQQERIRKILNIEDLWNRFGC